MSELILGSLFDGIAGFPLSASRHGITTKWASEIEPFPIKVTQQHFPNMKHLGDITLINGAEIEPVDVITFGSPCTRLSAAGKHDGFDITFVCEGDKENPHEKYINKIRATDKYQYIYTETCTICGQELIETNASALFFHAIRIISEMRVATNGIYPRFAIWENVPGAFSSNNGNDFRAVLEEITEAEIPMPKSGRWAEAGMVRGNGREVAWRVLDAQYWGLAQRRKRIFLVADFAGECAGEILFEREGMYGNTAESGETREEVASCTGNGIETTSRVGFAMQAIGEYADTGKASTIKQRDYKDATDLVVLMVENHPADSRVKIDETGTTQTLTSRMGTGGGNVPMLMQPTYAFSSGNSATARSIGFGEEISPTLKGDSGGNTVPSIAVAAGYTATGFAKYVEGVGTLKASGGDLGGGSETLVNIGYKVRRLTPIECLRLQGFPDDWLDIEKASDSAKYKAVGNSVAIPCPDFIFERIVKVLSGEVNHENRRIPQLHPTGPPISTTQRRTRPMYARHSRLRAI